MAAALAAMAVAVAVHAILGRPDPEDATALVATRAVPVGATLAPGDVEVRHLPPRAVPEGALTEPGAAIGRTTAVPLVPGRAVVPADLSTSALLEGLAEDGAAVYLPLGEPAVAASLAPGDRIDVHSPVDGTVVVPAAVVLRVEAEERPGLWVAVDGPDAVALAAARGADPVGASLQVSLRPTRTGG